jgi:hypothetical protein
MHSLAPCSENVCSPQSRHVAFDVAASSVENLPASHSVHSVRLRSWLKNPGLHGSHALASSGLWRYPALHAHARARVRPSWPMVVELPWHAIHAARLVAAVAPLYVSYGQLVQAWVPGVFLYLPARHAVHVSVSGSKW